MWQQSIHDVVVTDRIGERGKGRICRLRSWSWIQTPQIAAASSSPHWVITMLQQTVKLILQLLLLHLNSHILYIWSCRRSGMTRARFSRYTDTSRRSLRACSSLNPLWLALCWNSHRLSKQSNSGSIRPSIGGIETELVVSRGQEILTRALCKLPVGGRKHTHIWRVWCKHTHSQHIYTVYTDWTVKALVCYEPQIFVSACIQIYEYTFVLLYTLSSTAISFPTHSNRNSGFLGTQTTFTNTLISYEQIQVLSVQVGAVCQQFVSKWGHAVSFSSWISSWLPPRLLVLNWHSR